MTSKGAVMRANSRRGGVLSGILIGVAVLTAVALVTAAGFGLFVARHLTVREVHGNTVVETPFGSIRVREGTGGDLHFAGLPVYPGATRVGGKGKMASLEFDLGDGHEGFSVVAAEYTTSDPAERVAEFYRRTPGNWKYKRNSSGFVKDSGKLEVQAKLERLREDRIERRRPQARGGNSGARRRDPYRACFSGRA
jgi:hypothetical protein